MTGAAEGQRLCSIGNCMMTRSYCSLELARDFASQFVKTHPRMMIFNALANIVIVSAIVTFTK